MLKGSGLQVQKVGETKGGSGHENKDFMINIIVEYHYFVIKQIHHMGILLSNMDCI